MLERRPGLGLLFALALAACGSGGAAPVADAEIAATPQASAFSIRTESLPAGSVGTPYPAFVLALHAPDPTAATWALRSGALPDGMMLHTDGTIDGRPTLSGVWVFSVRATWGTQVAVKRLALAVDALGVFAQEGTTGDRAWSHAPVRLRAAGAVGPVAFSVDTETGGSFSGRDPVGGTATYVPGSTPGRDTVSVADERGTLATLSLEVRHNPIAERTARFGETDVWYLDVERREGTHPFASDLHAALASLGLRAPASHARMGQEADDLAALWVQLAIHRALNTYYLRDPSGARGERGLGISFPWRFPAAPHTTPVAGGRSAGAAHRYSTMALVDTNSETLAGRALIDDTGNTRHEHNAPDGAEALGVFVQAIAGSMRHLYLHSVAYGNPVGAGDTPTLTALIHGEPIDGTPRAHAIREIGEGFAQAVAKVAAHEIAHSLGLHHTEPFVAGSLMNSTIDVHPIATLRFTEADEQTLRQVLPGPGRTEASALHALLRGGGAGICSCGLTGVGR